MSESQLFHTGGYSRGNYNFAVSGLPDRTAITPIEATLFNILFRGSPTTPSIFLQEQLQEIGYEYQNTEAILPLEDGDIPCWKATIKGQDAFSNPALDFFEKILPKALGEYRNLLSLIRPECPIEDIVGSLDARALTGEVVDFFLPFANVVIEIDGSQHEERVHSQKDLARDKLLRNNNISVLRIKTKDLRKQESIESFSHQLLRHLKRSPLVAVYKKYSVEKCAQEDLVYTHAFRLQVILIEAMTRGLISLDDGSWNLDILGDVGQEVSLRAIQDIFNWIQLLDGRKDFPTVRLESGFDSLKIEIRISKRWDERSLNALHIYSATDHFDYFPESIPDYATARDYYRSIYSKTEMPFDRNNLNLTSLLAEVFGYEEFNPGQIEVIENVLLREDTIGILPTGGGKSLCYQLPGILSGGLTLVVCPIKSLMRDQVQELQQIGFHRAACIDSDTPTLEKERTLRRVEEGRVRFLFVSPERLQISTFRDSIKQLHRMSLINLVVIDEVHCMSEWGHDFRTSYLTLPSTIEKICTDSPILCLTATASTKVLEDIKEEFHVGDENVKTLSKYRRPNLHFKVHECDPVNAVVELVKERASTGEIALDKAAILFTSKVNGHGGAYDLYGDIQEIVPTSGFFTGSKPKMYSSPDFDKEKLRTQKLFKENKLSLLVATKAFGMGVNKKNVYTTVHAGLPQSVESLYQEAGRAGRDKTDSDCFVLFQPPSKEFYQQFFDYDDFDSFSQINTRKSQPGDLGIHHFFIKNSVEQNRQLADVVYNALRLLNDRTDGRSELAAFDVVGSVYDGKSLVELALYRLHQIGVITDWTIEDFGKGIFLVDYAFQHISYHNEKVRQLTDGTSLSEDEIQGIETIDDWLMALKRLCQMVVDHHLNTRVKSRIESLKTLLIACNDYDASNADEFRKEIESYFTVDETNSSLSDVVSSDYSAQDIIRYFLQEKKGYSLLHQNRKKIQNRLFPVRRYIESYPDSLPLKIINEVLLLHTDRDGSLIRLSEYLSELRLSVGDDEFLGFMRGASQAFDQKVYESAEDTFISSQNDIRFLDRFAQIVGSDKATGKVIDSVSRKIMDRVEALDEFV